MPSYRPGDYPAVGVTVDLVVLTIRSGALAVLTIRRGEAPFRGRWALPGGFLRPDEDLQAAAQRELAEETSLPAGSVHVEQLGTYGAPRRDPRMRVVTVAYLALAADLPEPAAGTDAAEARFADVADMLRPGRLAFDHHRILTDGVERARSKIEYTPLATVFCPDQFTVAELRRAYEAVWGVDLDPRNFHRKVTGATGFLVETGEMTGRDGGRPARLYRRGPLEILMPPLLRGAG
ncbi:8-oxo-dGTP diphosphatase [Nakamurella sp. UYEF19]|uniref:NUDIX hydrolase n=1 Tax=Nakamurella sp. UYEF19 TaxID=1756392 RepID=UPI00339AE8E7